jgi:hypothetical protein
VPVRGIRAPVAIGLLLVSPRAFAFDRAACFDAATEGQSLRDANRLVEARERFRVCAQDECPSSMKGDCATWLAEVERSLPGIVVLPAPVEPAETVHRSVAGPSARLTLAWALIGPGSVAIATGAAAGLTAAVDKDAAHCDADRRCDAGPLGSARTAATVADVGFAAGAALVAAGLALLLVPARHAPRESAWTVLPFSPVGGGLGIGAQTSW